MQLDLEKMFAGNPERGALLRLTHLRSYQEISRMPKFFQVREQIEQWIAENHMQGNVFEREGLESHFENAWGHVSHFINNGSFISSREIHPQHAFSYSKGSQNSTDELKEGNIYHGPAVLRPLPNQQDLNNREYFYRLGSRQRFLSALEGWLDEKFIKLSGTQETDSNSV